MKKLQKWGFTISTRIIRTCVPKTIRVTKEIPVCTQAKNDKTPKSKLRHRCMRQTPTPYLLLPQEVDGLLTCDDQNLL